MEKMMMLRTMISAAATVALLAFGGATAQAECTTNSAGISKDGSLAPLQQPGAAATNTTTGTTGAAADASGNAAGGIAKDGSTMPMASEPGGGNANVATSPQDVQSQQSGQATAAAGAKGTSAGSSTNC
jgi:hypothetical protein